MFRRTEVWVTLIACDRSVDHRLMWAVVRTACTLSKRYTGCAADEDPDAPRGQSARVDNAIFCPGTTAVEASGLGGSSITVRANYVEGGLAGASLDQSQFFSGGSAATAFTNPQSRDFWPRATGSLVGKSDAAFVPANDFNERPRGAPSDGGAYEANGLASNPGWRIVPGFKQTPLRRGGSIKMLLQTRLPVTREFSGRSKCGESLIEGPGRLISTKPTH
jgi:hypothetical protein